MKFKLLKIFPVYMLVAAFAMGVTSVTAQDDRFKDYREVYRDTVDFSAPTYTYIQNDTILDPMRVVTNRFGKNWFVFATAGVHTFKGDYSKLGKFEGTISPEIGIGVGKWFTPGIGLKVEFIRSNSRGYTGYTSGHYGYGDILQTADGTPYRKMLTRWWDISGSVILNMTRLFLGYEGYMSPKRMNQVMVNMGLGGVHHMGYGDGGGSDNEWSAHAELQYSRFFTRSKRFSLDLKARGIFYQTNFDLEYGQANHGAYKWDFNAGVAVGFTFYLDKQRNGWRRGTQSIYQRDYRERRIMVVKERDKTVRQRTMTFFVFYPNNYSGRSDAPTIAGSQVNALDYLAGGLFTQKRYDDNAQVAKRLAAGGSLLDVNTVDIPTELANVEFGDDIPRGYELSETPLSLSMSPDSMNAFCDKYGFYYAPIYDGKYVWNYRIDRETYGQRLLLKDNYMESASFGLNARRGLDIIRENMDVDRSDELVSYADVYAAMNTNEGYISQFTDSATVEHIKRIFDQGTITMIQIEGLATSQDNYTGENAQQVGLDRNTALSQHRAHTVINWLKGRSRLNDISSQIFMVGSMQHGQIRTVTDKSTRGLNAKLNRCVKVRIHYMLQ